MISFVIGALFSNAGISIDLDNLVDSAPCKDKIRNCVTENAIDTVLLTQDSVQKNSHIYISSDKGNKKGNKNLAKFIFWFDVAYNEIKKFC